MKKILFFFSLASFFIFSPSAFGLDVSQIKDVDTATPLFGLVSPDTVIAIITKLVLVIITVIATVFFKKLAQAKLLGYLETKLEGRGGGEEVIGVIARSVNITILIIGTSITLGILGVDLGIFMGGIGFGIGFTLKTFLTNFVAGIIMVTQGVYHNGDLIDVGGNKGRIVKINALFTAIEKLDGVMFYIPNIKFLEERVDNYNSNDKRRIEVEILVDYDTDLIKAKAVLNKVTDNFPSILKNPGVKIVIEKLDDSGILILSRFWISSAENYVEIRSNVTETINLAFKQSDIKIPYPHMQIIK